MNNIQYLHQTGLNGPYKETTDLNKAKKFEIQQKFQLMYNIK